MKREADELVALAHTLWEICCDKYDAHCVVDANGSWHFTGPTSVLNNVIASEVITKEMEMLRANMDDWGFDYE
jgi:hypothetical protein